MGWWPFDEKTTIGIIAILFGGGGVFAVVINGSLQKALKNQDTAAAGLSAVLSGYNSLIDQHQKIISILRQEVADLETKMIEQGQECDRRIKHLEDEMLRLHEMYQRRAADLLRQPRSTDP